ncbi:alpha/beta fold hydrolase [Larkinella soli]|uniref:alpha/beta fold hydrolase n=1 Tax=Larkinella soli TaxID=1770527 RepID=UPI000FFB9EE8|nr:alpha/beta hydrolase [Larkinella soli]
MKKACFMALLALAACQSLDPAQPGNLVARTVDEDPSLPSVTLSGTRLHVQTYGDPKKTKVFVLEGGPGDDFRSLLPLNQAVDGWSLPANYQVVYHDYRGCGLSRRHPMSELTMAQSLGDLEELIDRLAPGEPVVLVGHSHGGKVAVQYVNQHPERVKGLVLLEPGSFSSEIVKNTPSSASLNYFGADVNRILWAKQLIGMGNHQQADYVYDLAKLNQQNAGRGEDCPPVYYRSGTAAVIAIALGEVENGTYDFTTNLSRFTKPVLFISSEFTDDIGYAFQEKYHVGYFRQHEHVKIPGTGHEGIVNCKAAESLRHIRRYLSQVP